MLHRIIVLISILSNKCHINVTSLQLMNSDILRYSNFPNLEWVKASQVLEGMISPFVEEQSPNSGCIFHLYFISVVDAVFHVGFQAVFSKPDISVDSLEFITF